MSVSTGQGKDFPFRKMKQLTMIVEERGIPVWTRVRLPPGPSLKTNGNNAFSLVKDLKIYHFYCFRPFRIVSNHNNCGQK